VIGKSAIDLSLDVDILEILHNEEKRTYGKNGRFYDVVVQPVKDKRGKTVGKILIARDITDIKRYQDQLKELNKYLEEKVRERTEEVWKLVKQKDGFIKQLGHDLKTPLTPIISLLPLVKEKVKDEEVKRLLDIISRNITHIKNLVTDTLSLAQLSTPSYKPKLEKLNLRSVVDECLRENEYLIKVKDMRPLNEIDESISVKADKLRLKEVFANLISNSVKYTPRGR